MHSMPLLLMSPGMHSGQLFGKGLTTPRQISNRCGFPEVIALWEADDTSSKSPTYLSPVPAFLCDWEMSAAYIQLTYAGMCDQLSSVVVEFDSRPWRPSSIKVCGTLQVIRSLTYPKAHGHHGCQRRSSSHGLSLRSVRRRSPV